MSSQPDSADQAQDQEAHECAEKLYKQLTTEGKRLLYNALTAELLRGGEA